MILDAGLLIAVDREERAARSFLAAAVRTDEVLRTTAPVVAQVWRDGRRQARLAQFLATLDIHPFDRADAGAVGKILSNSGTADVVDAHLVVLAVQIGDGIITSDAHDFAVLVGHLGSDAPKIHHWQHESRR
ncbi:MAG: twitching motility protein PilT [bacterium]|nr:twitching motility protein PilT [bacterium]